MSRAGLAGLGLIAAVLVMDGAPRHSDAAGRPGGAAAFRAADVAAIVGRVNPALPEAQLRRIGRAVIQYSEKYDLDPELVTAVLLVESSARPWARSPKGAVGLMQLMPHMAGALEMAGNLATIESNVEAGCLILADNIRRLGEADGISAYFWGTDIRGAGYLDRVRQTRATVRSQPES